jgi:hypothetical protein
MSRFPLRSQQIEVRGEKITVRELSHKQKAEWSKRVQEDRYSALPVFASLVVDPPVSADEADAWPAEVLEQIYDIGQKLSGIETDGGAAEKNV